MPFSNPQAVIRLYPPSTLPGIQEGDWVDVVSIYTAGMRQRVTAKAMHVRMNASNLDSNSNIQVDAFLFRQTMLEEIVKAWSDSAPITPETLAELPATVVDWIMEEFNRRSEERTDTEKKELETHSNSSQLEVVSTPMNLVT